MTQLPQLPVLETLEPLKTALATAARAVLVAPPGSGKTTVVPLALLDEAWLRGRKILILEPRRLAARAAAARMAHLLGEGVGERVGYQIRFERRGSAATRIEVITEGLLTRRLQSDPELPGVGLVIFDEFHERSLDADLALALTLDARSNLNPDLRVLVMSATLDPQAVARLLGGAPVIESAGKSYPVAIRYRSPKPDENLDATVAQGVLAALSETAGDILAFLPGGREIRGAQRRLAERVGAGVDLLPLFGDMDSAAQDAVLRPAAAGRRKVILATNIAQTSLTIEGITTVVDGGHARVARFDRGSGANRLETQRISRAAADQRAGRAGRLDPGVAYRLWSAEQQGRLVAQDTPEILVSDLARLALELALWGVSDPATLAWLDLPPATAWRSARELLRELDALDRDGQLTAHGRELARLPTAPRRGHMLLTARRQGLGSCAVWVAALLEERDGRFDTADLAVRLQALREGHSRAFDPAARRRVQEAAQQLARLVEVAAAQPPIEEDPGEDPEEDLGRIVAWAYPERLARRRPGQGPGAKEIRYQCADGGEASLRAQDPLSRNEWLAIAHWEPGVPRRVYLAAAIADKDVERDHAQHIRWHSECHWDAQAACVVAEEQRRLGALVLARRDQRAAGGEAVLAAMLEGIRALGLAALPWSETTRQWQARVLSLRAWRPDEDWPDVSDEALAGSPEAWLGPYLDGISRREHLARLDLSGILNNGLDYARQQTLARLAPTHLPVPSGSRIALDYQPPGPPVLSVKLQELFGLNDTPTVNDGRSRVSLHLLSPARRPIQVTQDLAGFWARTYPEVRKELKGRYPKHPWPEDPHGAQPTARAKPRQR
ncbi:MAG: ATP-dependent helicase HrpB [Nevskiales bacterium]